MPQHGMLIVPVGDARVLDRLADRKRHPLPLRVDEEVAPGPERARHLAHDHLHRLAGRIQGRARRHRVPGVRLEDQLQRLAGSDQIDGDDGRTTEDRIGVVIVEQPVLGPVLELDIGQLRHQPPVALLAKGHSLEGARHLLPGLQVEAHHPQEPAVEDEAQLARRRGGRGVHDLDEHLHVGRVPRGDPRIEGGDPEVRVCLTDQDRRHLCPRTGADGLRTVGDDRDRIPSGVPSSS